MEFVTFEIAKKLKEKGFREKCFATYIPYECYKDSNIVAPTISQVLKWLREKHLLVIPVPSYFNAEGICISWDCDIWADDNYEHCHRDKKTYEEAALAGVNYCLENLI